MNFKNSLRFEDNKQCYIQDKGTGDVMDYDF